MSADPLTKSPITPFHSATNIQNSNDKNKRGKENSNRNQLQMSEWIIF